LSEIKIKPNLLQTGAVSILLCLDDKEEKIDRLASEASTIFDVQVEKGLTLLTIRHYNDPMIEQMTVGKKIILKQQSPEIVQLLMK
jgi:aspartate kinase